MVMLRKELFSAFEDDIRSLGDRKKRSAGAMGLVWGCSPAEARSRLARYGLELTETSRGDGAGLKCEYGRGRELGSVTLEFFGGGLQSVTVVLASRSVMCEEPGDAEDAIKARFGEPDASEPTETGSVLRSWLLRDARIELLNFFHAAVSVWFTYLKFARMEEAQPQAAREENKPTQPGQAGGFLGLTWGDSIDTVRGKLAEIGMSAGDIPDSSGSGADEYFFTGPGEDTGYLAAFRGGGLFRVSVRCVQDEDGNRPDMTAQIEARYGAPAQDAGGARLWSAGDTEIISRRDGDGEVVIFQSARQDRQD